MTLDQERRLACEGIRLGRRVLLCALCDREATHVGRIPGDGREWTCGEHKGWLRQWGATPRRIGGGA